MPNLNKNFLEDDALDNKLGNKKSVRFEEKTNNRKTLRFDSSNKTDLSEANEDDNGNLMINNNNNNHKFDINENKNNNKMIYNSISQKSDPIPQNSGLIRNFLKVFRQFRSENNSPNLNGECLSSSKLSNSTSTSSIESSSRSKSFCIR